MRVGKAVSTLRCRVASRNFVTGCLTEDVTRKVIDEALDSVWTPYPHSLLKRMELAQVVLRATACAACASASAELERPPCTTPRTWTAVHNESSGHEKERTERPMAFALFQALWPSLPSCFPNENRRFWAEFGAFRPCCPERRESEELDGGGRSLRRTRLGRRFSLLTGKIQGNLRNLAIASESCPELASIDGYLGCIFPTWNNRELIARISDGPRGNRQISPLNRQLPVNDILVVDRERIEYTGSRS
jgi:hypothetical protein